MVALIIVDKALVSNLRSTVVFLGGHLKLPDIIVVQMAILFNLVQHL